MAPRVSVIIPCFNDGQHAIEAVASVREEEPVEIVVVDDGSSQPETLAALDQMRQRGVQVISQANEGVSAARMAGVEETTGEYVYPLDADDRVVSRALSVMADALARDPNAGFVYGDFEIFGDFRGRWSSPERFSLWAQTWANFIPIASLIRRSALLDVRGWEAGLEFEDWDLWLKLGEAGWNGIHIPRVVYHRRLHGARKLAAESSRRRRTVEMFRRRHPNSFGRRRELAREEGIPLVRRLAYPVIFALRNRNLVPHRLEATLLRWHMMWRLRRAEEEPRSRPSRG